DLVQGTERRVPLSYQWVPDLLLSEHLEWMANGTDASRRTPALVFCFNRDECWEVAEQLKGKSLLADGQQKKLAVELEKLDLTKGVGPKLKQILFRGVGVHHAGLLPKYKRIVEDLFQQKLLSVCVCTETLSAGINLPARSVVITSLIKGPPGKKKVIEPSAAHQMFGRAGRPQFDKEGFVYALAHEDDVKILRWKEKYDQIPEDTKDPMLIRAKKAMKKKQPKRRETEQYWNKEQFEKLRAAPPGKLSSQGPLPWRLLAYLLEITPDVLHLRDFVAKRLLEGKHVADAQKELNRRLISLWAGGYVTLEPEPPADSARRESPDTAVGPTAGLPEDQTTPEETFGQRERLGQETGHSAAPSSAAKFLLGQALKDRQEATGQSTAPEVVYRPDRAVPTEKLAELMTFRSVNPIYGMFLIEHLGKANREERIQAFESVLGIARSAAKYVRVPRVDVMPFGPLATEFLHPTLLRRGLATAAELGAMTDEEEEEFWEEGDRPRVLTLAEKLRLLFQAEFPDVTDVPIQACWTVGALLQFGGDFHKLVSARQAAKQEGILFRHLLRFVLLLEEFIPHCPPELDEAAWRDELRDIANQVTASCREVDSQSTEQMLEEAHAATELDAVVLK
ncbi:MAG: helicase, partial [Planctomycetota bacterium]